MWKLDCETVNGEQWTVESGQVDRDMDRDRDMGWGRDRDRDRDRNIDTDMETDGHDKDTDTGRDTYMDTPMINVRPPPTRLIYCRPHCINIYYNNMLSHRL